MECDRIMPVWTQGRRRNERLEISNFGEKTQKTANII